MFGDMEKSNSSSNGVLFTKGLYDVRLKGIEFRSNDYKGRTVLFTFAVESSTNPEHPVGATRVWIAKPFDNKPDQNKRVMADIKSLIFALTGTSKAEVGSHEKNPEVHKQATSLFLAAIDPDFAKKNGLDGTELIGHVCKVECEGVTGKTGEPLMTKSGQPYTRCNWSPASKK